MLKPLLFTLSLSAIAAPVLAHEGPVLAPPSCDYGTISPQAPPELAQFDFLVGDYTIEASAWRGGDWVVAPNFGPARWNGRYILGGMAIEDQWFDKDPAIDPSTNRGVNVRMWDPEAEEFDMIWVYTGNHQGQDLRAKMIDGRLTMWQVYPERPNFRAYFNQYEDGSWERISLVPDGEGGWANQFRLRATPLPCPVV